MIFTTWEIRSQKYVLGFLVALRKFAEPMLDKKYALNLNYRKLRSRITVEKV